MRPDTRQEARQSGVAADFEGRRKHRFNVSLGQDRRRGGAFHGNLDELRVSNVVRYTGDFPLPGSFSRNYRANAPPPATANGLPLLFGRERNRARKEGWKEGRPAGVLELGSRKHVFIDDVLLERQRNLSQARSSPAPSCSRETSFPST